MAEVHGLTPLARFVLIAGLGLLVIGVVLNGFGLDDIKRAWRDLGDRPGGPMSFRFVLQPVMATIAATYDGVADARAGRGPYLHALIYEPASRGARLSEGISATARILLLSMIMEAIYQWRVLGQFYPGEAVIVTLVLAFLPYLVLRGPITRTARWWLVPASSDLSGEEATMTYIKERTSLVPDIEDRWSHAAAAQGVERPTRLQETSPPPIPDVDATNSGLASVQYSLHRTELSTHRTSLSEHRTALSEHRTDLSIYRTDLSTERTEMSMRRTGMSFQRTRMSADRTLMSVIRTSLSLISFGFTIYQVFEKLRDQALLTGASAGRNFGTTLVALGILMLVVGIVYHVQFMLGLREIRGEMAAEGLIHAQSSFPTSFILITAVLLLIIGIVAISSMLFNIGPFG